MGQGLLKDGIRMEAQGNGMDSWRVASLFHESDARFSKMRSGFPESQDRRVSVCTEAKWLSSQ